MIFMLMH